MCKTEQGKIQVLSWKSNKTNVLLLLMPANRTVNKKEFIEQCQQAIIQMPERTNTVLKFVATFDSCVRFLLDGNPIFF